MKTILRFFLACYSATIFAAPTLTIMVKGDAPQFFVTLPANPTTGYQWVVKQYDKKLLQEGGSEYMAPKTTLIGAGGNTRFTFKRTKSNSHPKSTVIQFRYVRSWEPDSGSEQQVIILFK